MGGDVLVGELVAHELVGHVHDAYGLENGHQGKRHALCGRLHDGAAQQLVNAHLLELRGADVIGLHTLELVQLCTVRSALSVSLPSGRG